MPNNEVHKNVKQQVCIHFKQRVSARFKAYMKGFEGRIPAIIVCYIFWDYENCPKVKNTTVDDIIWALKKIFNKIVKNSSSQIVFRVAYNPEHQKTTLADQFITNGITPTLVGSEPHAADNALISYMVEQTENHPAPAIVVLITSDGGPTKVSNGIWYGGFAEQLKKMSDLKYLIYLLHQDDVHGDLKLFADEPPLLWPNLMEMLREKTTPLKVVQCYNTKQHHIVRDKCKRTYDENDEEVGASQEASTSSKSVPQKMKKDQ